MKHTLSLGIFPTMTEAYAVYERVTKRFRSVYGRGEQVDFGLGNAGDKYECRISFAKEHGDEAAWMVEEAKKP